MGHAAQRAGARHRRDDGAPVNGEATALLGMLPLAAEVTLDAIPARKPWLRRYGGYAIWLVPVQAVLVGIVSLHRHPGPGTGAGWRHWPVPVAVAALGLLGLLAIAGLAAGGRGRRIAIVALVAGTAGTGILLYADGTVTVAYPALGRALVATRSTLPAHAMPILLGVGLLTLGWLLAGAAAIGSPALGGSDGLLLLLAAPLVYLGGLVLPMLPTLGALVLLAAGAGLAATVWRPVR